MDDNELLAWVRSVLNTTPERWMRLVQDLPYDLLTMAPAPKEWSALDCLQHLLDTEPVFTGRLQSFALGQDFDAYDPDTQGTKPLGSPNRTKLAANLATRFGAVRKDSLARLAKVKPAGLDARVRHQELGPVTLREMLNEWAAHDLMHTVQAERALMQPFVRSCGPWVTYFQDHIVKASE